MAEQRITGANPTAGYVSSSLGLYARSIGYMYHGRAWWTYYDVPVMQRDAWLQFCARVWRAPFSQIQFKVNATSPEVQAWVQRQLDRFRRLYAPRLLDNYFWWGFAPGGIEWAQDKQQSRKVLPVWNVCNVRDVQPLECRPRVMKKGGQFCGMDIQTLGTVFDPYAFWFAGFGKATAFYDVAPSSGAYDDFTEYWSKGGARHLRNMAARLHSITPRVGRYPLGNSQVAAADGTSVRTYDNKELLLASMEQIESGANVVLPSTVDANGNKLWDLDNAKPGVDAKIFTEYPDDLRYSMAAGVGIPKEVIQAAETGSGWNGRRVPYQTFLSGVDELAGRFYGVVESQVMKRGVRDNFGKRADFEMIPQSLCEKLQSDPNGEGGQSQQQPQQPMGGGRPANYVGRGGGRGFKDPRTGRVTYMSGISLMGGVQASRPATTRNNIVVAAMLELQELAHAEGDPEKYADMYHYLADVGNDPRELRKLLVSFRDNPGDGPTDPADPVLMAWLSPLSKTGQVMAVGEGEDAGKVRYGKEAKRLLRVQRTRQNRQASAEKAGHLAAKIAAGDITAGDLQELADHLPALSIAQLRYARAKIMASFGGRSNKEGMVAKLVDHVKKLHAEHSGENGPEFQQPAGVKRVDELPKLAKGKSSKPLSDTLAQYVLKNHGGIDPKGDAFRATYSGMKEAIENGIPLNVFRTSQKGGGSLDTIAEQMIRDGMLTVPEDRHPADFLLEKIANGHKAHLQDSEKEYDAAYDAFRKAEFEAQTEGMTDEQRQELLRSSEAAARRQVTEELLSEHDSERGAGEGDASEAGGGGGTDFDFGANATDDDGGPVATEDDKFGQMPFPVEVPADPSHLETGSAKPVHNPAHPLDGLVATQDHVYPNFVKHYHGGQDVPPSEDADGNPITPEMDGKPIDVVRKGGKTYIKDGHHRATAAKLRGDKTIPANVVDLDAKPSETAPEEPKPGAVKPKADLTTGDTFRTADGKSWLIHKQRFGTATAHPIVNGKPVVNRDTGERFSLTDLAKARNPDDRTDLHPDHEPTTDATEPDAGDAPKPVATKKAVPTLTGKGVGDGWEAYFPNTISHKTKKAAVEQAASLGEGGGTGSDWEYAVKKVGNSWGVYKRRKGQPGTVDKSADPTTTASNPASAEPETTPQPAPAAPATSEPKVEAKPVSGGRVDRLFDAYERATTIGDDEHLRHAAEFDSLTDRELNQLAEKMDVRPAIQAIRGRVEKRKRLEYYFRMRRDMYARATHEAEASDRQRKATTDGYATQLAGLTGDDRKAKAKALIRDNPEHDEQIREAYKSRPEANVSKPAPTAPARPTVFGKATKATPTAAATTAADVHAAAVKSGNWDALEAFAKSPATSEPKVEAKPVSGGRVDRLFDAYERATTIGDDEHLRHAAEFDSLTDRELNQLAEKMDVRPAIQAIRGRVEKRKRLEYYFRMRRGMYVRATHEAEASDRQRKATTDGYATQLAGLTGDDRKTKAKALIRDNPEHDEQIREAYKSRPEANVSEPAPTAPARPTVFGKATEAMPTAAATTAADVHAAAVKSGNWDALEAFAKSPTTKRDDLIALAKDKAAAKKLPSAKIVALLKAEGAGNTAIRGRQLGDVASTPISQSGKIASTESSPEYAKPIYERSPSERGQAVAKQWPSSG